MGSPCCRYVDGFGLVFGSLIGANSLTVYIESAAGILEGGRTGLSAFVTALLFFLSTFLLAPFFSIIPNAATVCALVLVGVMSMGSLQGIDWDDHLVAYPTAVSIFVMAASVNITNGALC